MNSQRVFLIPFLVILSSICFAKPADAEDLWGNPIQFDPAKLTIVCPESSSNCGYCLVDGDWIKANYAKMQEETGGDFYLQMPFNTQRDILSFAKHYNEKEQKVINYPYSLWSKYHRDGYPFLYALKNNKLIFSDISTPYAAIYDSLGAIFWIDKKKQISLTSPNQLANIFLNENQQNDAIYIVPDSTTKKRFTPSDGNYKVKTIDELTDLDWHKNLSFYLNVTPQVIELFHNLKMPFSIKETNWQIGNYKFSIDSTVVSATFPNPIQEDKYISLNINGTSIPKSIKWDNIGSRNWIDFAFIQQDKIDPTELSFSLYGQFQKNWNEWSFADSLAYGTAKNMQCVGYCPVPTNSDKAKQPEKLKFSTLKINKFTGYRIEAESSFPRLISDKNIVYQTFEHNGDIYLARYEENDNPVILPVDVTSADSYDAIPLISDNHLWVFYLKKIFGFYKLCAKYQTNGLWSEEMTISAELPCDAISPSAIAYGKEITVCWTVWQANNRCLYQRKLINAELQPITKSRIVNINDYEDAWSCVMKYDNTGNLWKSWNQHYPYGFCVLASQSEDPAEVICTKDDNKLFGYPTLTLDSQNQPWIFYEDETALYSDDQQANILGVSYNNLLKKWSVPFELTDSKHIICQSPVSCTDKDGRIWVLWSERSDKGNWLLKCRYLQENKWSEPIQITSGKSSARSPEITAMGNNLIVAYHSNIKGIVKTETLFIKFDILMKD